MFSQKKAKFQQMRKRFPDALFNICLCGYDKTYLPFKDILLLSFSRH